VDLVGIEPTTSSMPWKRAPSCATGPLEIASFNSRLAWPPRQTLRNEIRGALDSGGPPKLG
jgi:hypothetical protein